MTIFGKLFRIVRMFIDRQGVIWVDVEAEDEQNLSSREA